jgi:hypothetical protein
LKKPPVVVESTASRSIVSIVLAALAEYQITMFSSTCRLVESNDKFARLPRERSASLTCLNRSIVAETRAFARRRIGISVCILDARSFSSRTFL